MLFGKKKQKKSIGKEGEKIAAKFLKRKGFRIITRNFKNNNGRQLGEIDIIAEKDKVGDILNAVNSIPFLCKPGGGIVFNMNVEQFMVLGNENEDREE